MSLKKKKTFKNYTTPTLLFPFNRNRLDPSAPLSRHGRGVPLGLDWAVIQIRSCSFPEASESCLCV